MANVLAEKAFYAFAEFLHAIDVALIHLPVHTFARFECGNFPVYFVIPRDVGDQILDQRERF
jgi:hypothetical protein